MLIIIIITIHDEIFVMKVYRLFIQYVFFLHISHHVCADGDSIHHHHHHQQRFR